MSSAKLVAVFLFACASLASAQIASFGSCPKQVRPMANFDAGSFLKTWYVQKSYFFIFEFGGKCTSANYSLNKDGSIKVENKQYNQITNMPQIIEGTAVFTNGTDVGALSVKFPTGPVSASAPYWVIDTDYTGYVLVWTCYDYKLFHASNAYIMTRERNPSKDIVDKALASAKKNGISTLLFLDNDQKDCQ